MVVFGDAEPHGAGTAGFAGCVDQTADPNSLDSKQVLAAMSAAQMTLIMVRQVSTKTTASLQCYQSLAAASYKGGTAKDGGADLATLVTTLVGKAVDTVKPTAKALPSSGVRGKVTKLRYIVNDNSGLTRERITVYQKTRVVFQGLIEAREGTEQGVPVAAEGRAQGDVPLQRPGRGFRREHERAELRGRAHPLSTRAWAPAPAPAPSARRQRSPPRSRWARKKFSEPAVAIAAEALISSASAAAATIWAKR